MYLHHVTLSTGHLACTTRDQVNDQATRLLANWLPGIINTGRQHPLPVDALKHHSVMATVQGGGLTMTVFAPAGPHLPGQTAPSATVPLVTFGVAQRSRQGGDLWSTLVDVFPAAPGLKKPAEPWCAVVLHPRLPAYSEPLDWLGDFERCVAWAWITRRPTLESVK